MMELCRGRCVLVGMMVREREEINESCKGVDASW